jgi:hypothetical protein
VVFSPLAWSTATFDALARRWHDVHEQRAVGTLVIATYLGSLAAIELQRRGLLPAPVSDWVPTNHFYAVQMAFTLLLLIEVIGLVFGLAESVASSLGTQLEIFSLILLRGTFKEFTKFQEPIRWEEVSGSLLPMASDALGAAAMFGALVLYYRLQKHQPITTPDERSSFIAAKKAIALLLLGAFLFIGFDDLVRLLTRGDVYPFFEVFYTVLIFSDVLIVLISLRYSSTYRVVFRNSGFAVTTVALRLALTAPPVVNAALGVGAVALACVVTLAYNAFQVPAERGAAAGGRPVEA